MADTASPGPDALDLILAAFKEGGVAPSYLDAEGAKVDSLAASSQVSFQLPEPAVLPKSTLTRLVTSRDLAAQKPTPTPATQPAAFLPLDAVLFALEHREEGPGAYLRLTTSAGLARLDARDRNAVLDYLVGKTDSWEGVISKETIRAVESEDSSTAVALPATAPSVDASAVPAAEASTQPAASTSTAPLASVQKRPYVPNAQDAEFVKRQRTQTEVLLRTRSDVLRSNLGSARVGGVSAKLVDFGGFRKGLLPQIEELRKIQAKGASGKGAAPAPTSATPSQPTKVRKARAQVPIILLSNSPTSLISMFNVKRLLEDGVFVPPEVAKAEAKNLVDTVVPVTRIWGGGASMHGVAGKSVRFLVVDSHEALSKFTQPGTTGADPWQRVVAVFTTGQSWQFKLYKWSDPRELFKNVMGVYMRYDHERQADNINQWNVTKFNIDVSKRHTDKMLVENFWRTLETWIERRKGWLLQ